jgi:hypothetical protein
MDNNIDTSPEAVEELIEYLSLAFEDQTRSKTVRALYARLEKAERDCRSYQAMSTDAINKMDASIAERGVLRKRLAEIMEERDVQRALCREAEDAADELRVKLAESVKTIKACRFVFQQLGFQDASIAIESIDATLSKIGEDHE